MQVRRTQLRTIACLSRIQLRNFVCLSRTQLRAFARLIHTQLRTLACLSRTQLSSLCFQSWATLLFYSFLLRQRYWVARIPTRSWELLSLQSWTAPNRSELRSEALNLAKLRWDALTCPKLRWDALNSRNLRGAGPNCSKLHRTLLSCAKGIETTLNLQQQPLITCLWIYKHCTDLAMHLQIISQTRIVIYEHWTDSSLNRLSIITYSHLIIFSEITALNEWQKINQF